MNDQKQYIKKANDCKIKDKYKFTQTKSWIHQHKKLGRIVRT